MSAAPCVLVPQHFGSLLFERRTSRYLPFDHAATCLLQRLADEPLGAVLEDLPPDEAEDARAFFGAFEPRGLFTADQRFAGEVRTSTPPPHHLLGPLAVHLEVIASCNLSCGHCFATPLPRNRELLTLPEMDRLFVELSRLGSFRLGLTGGEPLLRRELLDIVDAATARGLHPCLTTNGLLLDERWARELGRRPLVWLNVSLDGATAATNDPVRGAGTFERVLEKVRLLARYTRFTLSFTVMRHNAHEVEAFARLAKELGADTVVFRPLYPVGAAKHRPELMPAFEQYSDALARLGDALEPDGLVHAIDPFSPQARERLSATVHDTLGCGAAHTIATVSVRGDVNPCSFLGAGFDVANLRERTFEDIWNEGAGFVAMRQLSRTREPERFAGGCRARALAAHGDADAADPWQSSWEQQQSSTLPPSFTLPVGRPVDG